MTQGAQLPPHSGRVLKPGAWTAFICIAIALGIWAWLRPDSEPSFQGRKLSAWLSELSFYQTNAQHAAAVQALRGMGTNALPVLLKRIATEDSKPKEWLITADYYLFRNHRNIKPAYTLQMEAIHGFRALGEVANPAVPQLLKLFDEHPGTVANALAEMSTHESIRVLETGFSHSNRLVRGAVAVCSPLARSDEELLIPGLTVCLNDPDSLVRFVATNALPAVQAKVNRASGGTTNP